MRIQKQMMTHIPTFDVIIIGGSYAGLAAAMSLGRSLRNVLVIDSGLPCNRQTPHSHNFLTQDGKTPREISETSRAQVAQYRTVQFYDGLATAGIKTENGFEIKASSGDTFYGRKLILATGIKDLMPDIKGFSECWGISVIHCPYCHGYEFRDKKTAIMADAARATHLAPLVSNLTRDLSIIGLQGTAFDGPQFDKFKENNVQFIAATVKEIEHEAGYLHHVVTEDGSKYAFDAIYAGIPFVQQSEIPAFLGCEFTEQGHIKTDAFQKTSVHGVYACGDNTSAMRSVANAVAAGSLTGAMVNRDLAEELF
ncbi:NAD(P)/FAD-dependent oxidoreductase [Pedobacter faecalis]|uniref:NAD(P)/FAD-dependent oxidoreductase n=1 Tax=Pedobacter faecalis TaxID=3041495 RepID=UPI0025519E0E|nr:NAD(P)/FAD-dependent oxidoreductase [Pedobacter sp. ELA7]